MDRVGLHNKKHFFDIFGYQIGEKLRVYRDSRESIYVVRVQLYGDEEKENN